MSTLISRLYNWVTDKANSVKITASRVDAEMDQVITSLNRKVLCSATAPSNPINGQTWVDTTNNLVKAYLSNDWVIIANYIYIQSDTPTGMSEGYLWYDTVNNLLKSYDGSGWNAVGDMIYPDNTVQGDILYFTGEKTLARLAKNTNSYRVLTNKGSDNNPSWDQVNTSMLKTTTGEVSVTDSINYSLIIPGGEYGFYPQFKGSVAGSNYVIICGVGDYGHQAALTTSYQTLAAITATGGYTAYIQQRYVTSSGTDHWLFLLVDKNTLDIVCSYSAADHPAYGNGGDFNKVQHPFPGYDSDKYMICLADKESVKAIKAEVTASRSLLTIVNEDYKVGEEDLAYEPLHSGKFLTEDGKQVKEMVTKLADGIKVRRLIKYTEEEKAKLNG